MAGVYYFWFVRVSLLPRCFSQYILVIKYYLYINQCTLSLDILVFVMCFREVLRLSLAILSYESIDTALNQLYILIFNSCQWMNEVLLKIVFLRWYGTHVVTYYPYRNKKTNQV